MFSERTATLKLLYPWKAYITLQFILLPRCKEDAFSFMSLIITLFSQIIKETIHNYISTQLDRCTFLKLTSENTAWTQAQLIPNQNNDINFFYDRTPTS